MRKEWKNTGRPPILEGNISWSMSEFLTGIPTTISSKRFMKGKNYKLIKLWCPRSIGRFTQRIQRGNHSLSGAKKLKEEESGRGRE